MFRYFFGDGIIVRIVILILFFISNKYKVKTVP